MWGCGEGGVPLLKIKLEAETLGLGRVWTSGLGGGKAPPNQPATFPRNCGLRCWAEPAAGAAK